MPLDEPLGGGDELDLVFDDVTFFDDSLIVDSVALFDVLCEKIRIGATNDFLFAVEAHEVG